MHPLIVRRAVYPLLEWKSGGRVRQYLADLEQSQWWVPERIRTQQWSGLETLLRHAHAHVPYYRALFDRCGIHPADVRSLEDFKQIPLLTKDVVRDQGHALRAGNIAGPFVERRTSGSTGIPLSVHVLPHTRDRWIAAFHRMLRWWGLDVGLRQIRLVNLHGKSRMTLLKQYWLMNQGEYSVFDMQESSLARLYDQLVRSRCEILSGYPSALTHFAVYVAARHHGPPLHLRAVQTTAEMLYPDMRALLERVFACPVIDEYGSSECGSLAGTCPSGSLHIAAENVLIEFEPAAAHENGGSRWELIVTDLHNLSMPMLRYRIGDLGAPGNPCPCGRGLPVLRMLAGRTEDLVTLPDGRKIDGAIFDSAVEALIGRGVPVRQFRAVQHALDDVEILVATDAPGHHALQELGVDIQRVLGSRVHVVVKPVDHIPAEPTGKLRRFVSRITSSADGRDAR
jgi:phenylacetate-CoA ligase